MDPISSMKAQEMQKNQNAKFGSLALSDFNIYYKPKIIKAEWYCHKDTYKVE